MNIDFWGCGINGDIEVVNFVFYLMLILLYGVMNVLGVRVFLEFDEGFTE